jgi:transposase-like protein
LLKESLPLIKAPLTEFKAEKSALNKKITAFNYLNNRIENDHKFTKPTSRDRQVYQLYSSARNTIDSMETMRIIQKWSS